MGKNKIKKGDIITYLTDSMELMYGSVLYVYTNGTLEVKWNDGSITDNVYIEDVIKIEKNIKKINI